jgi:hypothetical protein
MAQRYPDDPWRVALVDNVRGGCLLGFNRVREAEPLLVQSTPVILKKWKTDALYGYDAKQRMAQLQTLTTNRD